MSAVDAIEQVNGLYSGFRCNHAKGICIAGTFESNGQGVRLSKAAVFRPGRVPVIGRFALAGSRPYAADAPTAVRSMVLSFRPRDAEDWRMGMNDIPVFAVTTAEAFYDQLLARSPIRRRASSTRQRRRPSSPPIRKLPGQSRSSKLLHSPPALATRPTTVWMHFAS
jgi:catalase